MKRITPRQREEIFRRAAGCCEYCKSQASFATQSFSTEHIYPQHLGGESSLDNLALSCQGCNAHKAIRIEWRDPVSGETVPLYHPRKQRWNEHFAWTDGFTIIVGLTPTGRATVEALHLNRQGLVNLRLALSTLGMHPPEDSNGQ